MKFAEICRVLFFIFFKLTCIVGDNKYTETIISNGRILGRVLKTIKNNTYYAFQDIPYAKPPIGTLRLKEAVRPDNWDGILNTTANLKICPQFQANQADSRENEDCLVLNVYTPVDPNHVDSRLRPVLFWIHGGSFLSWSGYKDAFGPDYFIDEDVVVVTINYRLGPLGFLSTGDGVIPANLGLRDQHFALKWVQENIQVFGGNRESVTIAGQSAGATSVGYQLLYKKSSGLYSGAIMQSGTPLTCWSLQKNPKGVAEQFVNVLQNNQKNYTSQEIRTIIESADLDDLKTATLSLQATSDTANCHEFTSTLISPVEENPNDENAFVAGLSHQRLLDGDFNNVSLLIGFNSEESLLFGLQGILYQTSLFDGNLGSSITANLNIKNENKYSAGKEIRNIYTNDTYESTPAGSVHLASDSMFAIPIIRHAHLASYYAPVYLYQFSYRGTLGKIVYDDLDGASGVAHQEELGYLWHNSTNRDLSQYPPEDVKMKDHAVNLWASFIKNKNPTSDTSEVSWPCLTPEGMSYMDINSEITVRNHARTYDQWHKIVDTYAEKLLSTYE